jgi:hypothetical protein
MFTLRGIRRDLMGDACRSRSAMASAATAHASQDRGTSGSWPLAGAGAELGSGQVVGQHDLTAECHPRFPASRWASPES